MGIKASKEEAKKRKSGAIDELEENSERLQHMQQQMFDQNEERLRYRCLNRTFNGYNSSVM